MFTTLKKNSMFASEDDNEARKLNEATKTRFQSILLE